MKIIVLGAGAIGSLYGAKLSKLNYVVLIARKEHSDAINKNGLKIIGIENSIYKIKAATKITQIRRSALICALKGRSITRLANIVEFAGLKIVGLKSEVLNRQFSINKIEKNMLILLTTKVQDSKNAIKEIKNLIRNDTIILCLQNGLYSENIVKNIVGNKCLVLRAITNFGAIFLKPGVVDYKSYSYTSIEKSPRSEEIAENFAKCGLNCLVSENIKYDMWKKLVFNCVLNPVTALLGIKNSGICDKRLNPLKKLIIDECLKVAEKDGIKFGIDFLKAINEEFISSKNISSMQQDLIKGKKTEIDYLNGAVVKLGEKYGIKCPVNEALTAIIKEMEKPWR